MGSEETEKKTDGGLAKVIAKIAFSHLGLCCIVIIYCVLGGFLFELLEKENEIATCMEARKEYDDMENSTLFSLLDVILENPLESNATDAQLAGIFESFRNNVIAIDYDGSWCEGYGLQDGPTHEWTFAGGLFFSMTVITTIGYGHIAPKTIWGRVLCISYAMMGIPLMLLFLANIGDVLADIFRYIYATIICCGCCRPKKRNRDSQEIRETTTGDTRDNGVNRRLSLMEHQQMVANLKRRGSIKAHKVEPTMARQPPTFSTKEGIVAKSFVPDETSLASSSRSHIGFDPQEDTGIKQSNNPLNIKALDKSALADRGYHFRSSPTQPLVVDDDSDDDDDDDEWKEISEVSVPLTVSLGIIGLYIFGGGILFKFWEGWDMTQSGYFCFITLSTIGFGDVTPGRDFSDPTANARLVIGTIYSIFGMAILSMCFTLMQEEMVSKFMWLGRKLGVVEDGDGDENFSSLENVDKNSTDC